MNSQVRFKNLQSDALLECTSYFVIFAWHCIFVSFLASFSLLKTAPIFGMLFSHQMLQKIIINHCCKFVGLDDQHMIMVAF